MLVSSTAAAADFPVGTFVCAFDVNAGPPTHTVKIGAVTVGGVELPMVDVKAVEGPNSSVGSLRGIGTYSDDKFSKYIGVAAASSTLWMVFDKDIIKLEWRKVRFGCKAK